MTQPTVYTASRYTAYMGACGEKDLRLATSAETCWKPRQAHDMSVGTNTVQVK